MANLLQQADDWLAGMFQKHASSEVVYRWSGGSVNLQATMGRTRFELHTGDGVLTELESRDFIVVWEEFRAKVGSEPKPGDRIEEFGPEAGPAECVYEVMSPGDGPCWRFSDLHRRLIRIHTKLVQSKQ